MLLVLALFLADCDHNSRPEYVWLADLQNPFVGSWESKIPSMDNARMVSEYKSDGTFTCGFPEVSGFEGPFYGGYSVTDDILICWLDYEGESAYKFKVVDNNKINVTEYDDLEEGNTTPFVRVPGSAVNRENKPLSLNNVFIGKWQAEIPSMDNAKMLSEYKSDGKFTCGFPEVSGFEGPFYGAYIVFTNSNIYISSGTYASNVMVSYTAFEGAASYTFNVTDGGGGTISVTEITGLEGGTFTVGSTSMFTRVQN